MEALSGAYNLLVKGGAVMYAILACSVWVVAVGIERWGYYRRAGAAPGPLIAKVRALLAAGDVDGARRACDASEGAVAQVLRDGLGRWGMPVEGLRDVLDASAGLAAAKLRQRLLHLETAVTLAPLLGLLGTVSGMIQSFSVLNLKAGQPLAITGGVGEALIATAAGLTVAIIALVVHTYFVQRLDSIITDIEQACALLLEAAAAGAAERGSKQCG